MPINPKLLQADPCLRTDEKGKVTLHAAGLVWECRATTNRFKWNNHNEFPSRFSTTVSGFSIVVRLSITDELMHRVWNEADQRELQQDYEETNCQTFGEAAVVAVAAARELLQRHHDRMGEALAALNSHPPLPLPRGE